MLLTPLHEHSAALSFISIISIHTYSTELNLLDFELKKVCAAIGDYALIVLSKWKTVSSLISAANVFWQNARVLCLRFYFYNI